MREYEIVYIFDQALTEDQVNERLEKFHTHITDGAGEVTAVDHWGKRQFAYPINKQRSGYYVVVQFTAEAAVLPELERTLKLQDDLVRYLIVLSEGEPTGPTSAATGASSELEEPEASEEDDDDDDEEEEEDEDEDEDDEDDQDDEEED